MKKILIAGSCSPLASNFIRNVLYEKLDYKISCFDIIQEKKYMKNAYISKNCTFYFADIRDSHIIENIIDFERPDCFLDFTDVGLDINLQSIISNIKDYIFVSNYYSPSHLSKQNLNLPNMRTISLPKIYGPRQFLPSTIPQMLQSGLRDTKNHLNVNPMQEEYWMNFFDAQKNLKSFIDDESIKQFNCFGKQQFNYLEIQQRISKILNKSLDITYENMLPLVPRDLTIDVCQQEFSIIDGLDQAADWYNSNQQWIFK